MNTSENLLSRFHRFGSLCLHILFPSMCLCCGKHSSIPLCTQCITCLPHKKTWHCPRCQKKITPLGATCTECFGKTPLDGVFSAAPYKHPLINRIITAYKYGLAQSLAQPLSAFLLDTLRKNDIPLPDTVLSVPLHSRRLRWRGFNQSSLLATHVAQKLLPQISLEISTETLQRNRYTLPQAKISDRKERLRNLHNAFTFFGDATPIKGKRIWLVDDVSTTGSTLIECAHILKKKGAKEVWGIVLAS